jgi:hypothetical protein
MVKAWRVLKGRVLDGWIFAVRGGVLDEVRMGAAGVWDRAKREECMTESANIFEWLRGAGMPPLSHSMADKNVCPTVGQGKNAPAESNVCPTPH